MKVGVGVVAMFACMLSLVSQVVGAKVWVVAPDGKDGARGSLAAPLRTVAEATGRAQPGDTIELREGVYGGAVIRNPGSAKAWIRMRPHAKERAVIQGQGSGAALYFYHRSCDEDEPSAGTACQPMFWELEGLEVRGSPQGGEDGNAIKIDTPHVRLIGNDLCCSRADVVKLVRTANDVEILHNRIHHPNAKNGDNAQGIDIVGADRTQVAFNHVHDIPSIGMYAKGNARDTIFEHNRVERTWSHGIMLGQSTDEDKLVDGRYESYDGVIRDNIVTEAGWACFATASSSNVRIHNNTCYGTGLQNHGSVLVSNESELEQAGTRISITHNLIVGGSRLPMVKITNNALTDVSTLQIDHNLYATRCAAPFRFSWHDRELKEVDYKRWQEVTGLDRHSSVLAELPFVDLINFLPKPGSAAWDAGATPSSVSGCSSRPAVGARPACP